MVTVNELLNNIAVACVSKSNEAVFEKGEPTRVVPLDDLINVLHKFEKEFDGWELVI